MISNNKLYVYKLDHDNIKNIESVFPIITPKHKLDECIIDQLAENTSYCFQTKPQKYYCELLNLLYPGEIEKIPEKICKNENKLMEYPEENDKLHHCYYNKYFITKPLTKENLKNRYELVILYDGNIETVLASCIVQYKKMYNMCEIHEVCSANANPKNKIKGLCKELIQKVKEYLEDKCNTILIYCEKENAGACCCYSKIFECENTEIFNIEIFTGFLYHTQKSQFKLNKFNTKKRQCIY